MDVNVIMPELEIHCTPLEEIAIDPYCIKISFDDINENRYEIIVKPYQALRITTIDCVSAQEFYNDYCYRGGRFHRHILQIDNSEYLKELIAKSENADFIKNSKHYLLPMQDIIIEFVSDRYQIQKIE